MELTLFLLVIAGFYLYYKWWERTHPEEAARLDAKIAEQNRIIAEAKRAQKATQSQLLSQVGVRDEAGNLHCPHCGGTQFKARRSKGTRWGVAGASTVIAPVVGLASLAFLPQDEVQCITCGRRYMRG